jgi:predicted amidohydrolase
MKCAALQMVSSDDLQSNLAAASQLVEQAAAQGAELVLLPEYFCLLGQRDTDKLAVQEPLGCGPIQETLAGLAARHGVWLLGGTLPLASGDDPLRVYNSTLAYDPQGQRIGRYDKIHLFRFQRGSENYDESRVLRAGHQPQAITVCDRSGQHWQVGLSVCYDLRFPELYRALAADIWVVPSAFTYTTGQAHWELLLRARAVENQCYVIAAAQGGVHRNGRHTWGHSMVVDPWGTVLAEQPQGAAVVVADLQPQRLAEVRGQLPALNHRVLQA